jgi:hypothetical protein
VGDPRPPRCRMKATLAVVGTLSGGAGVSGHWWPPRGRWQRPLSTRLFDDVPGEVVLVQAPHRQNEAPDLLSSATGQRTANQLGHHKLIFGGNT